MKSHIYAARAISGVAFQRVFAPLAIVVLIIVIILYALLFLLASKVSLLWLIFLIVMLPATIAIVAIGLSLWKLSHMIMPRKLDKTERTQVNNFVESLINTNDLRTTPPPLLAIRIGKDLFRKQKSAYLDDVIGNSRTLKSDFDKIANLFNDK